MSSPSPSPSPPPPLILNVHAALFDVDGTIVDSSGPILAFWKDFGTTHPYISTSTNRQVSAEHVFDHSHGWRTYDVICKYSPESQYANDLEAVTQLESSVPDRFGSSAKEIPGAIALVNDLLQLDTPDGKERIAVGTSGTRSMASKWFDILELNKPKVFITAEDVTRGKPDPEPYLQGRERLGYGALDKRVVVFEDAQAGIQAGHSAGCFVVGIASTYDAETVIKFGADAVVKDLKSVRVNGYDPETDTFQLLIDEYHHVSDRLLEMCKQF